MTDNEIVKALECCSSDDDESCQDKACPLIEYCKKDLKSLEKAALDLINRIKGESNKYRNQSQAQKGELTRLYKQVTEQKAKIESLESRIFALNDTNKMLMDSQEIYWKNRVKEFAERLKKRIGDAHFQNYGLAILEIQDLVKERTEDDAHGRE